MYMNCLNCYKGRSIMCLKTNKLICLTFVYRKVLQILLHYMSVYGKKKHNNAHLYQYNGYIIETLNVRCCIRSYCFVLKVNVLKNKRKHITTL